MMTRLLTVFMLGLGLLFYLGNVAQAFPGSAVGTGNSCSSCHSSDGGSNPMQPTGDPESDRMDALEVLGESFLNLDGKRNDGKTRGPLANFTVQPNGTIELTMQVLDGSDNYAVQLKRLEKAGVLVDTVDDFLTDYEADGGWVAQGSLPSTYFTSTSVSTGWPVISPDGPDLYTFTLKIAADTPLNVYDLEFAVAGNFANTSQEHVRFYDDQHFYVSVVPEPSTLALLGMAGLGVFGLWRRRQ